MQEVQAAQNENKLWQTNVTTGIQQLSEKFETLSLQLKTLQSEKSVRPTVTPEAQAQWSTFEKVQGVQTKQLKELQETVSKLAANQENWHGQETVLKEMQTFKAFVGRLTHGINDTRTFVILLGKKVATLEGQLKGLQGAVQQLHRKQAAHPHQPILSQESLQPSVAQPKHTTTAPLGKPIPLSTYSSVVVETAMPMTAPANPTPITKSPTTFQSAQPMHLQPQATQLIDLACDNKPTVTPAQDLTPAAVLDHVDRRMEQERRSRDLTSEVSSQRSSRHRRS